MAEVPRRISLYRVLKPTGSFYYHCDWHASHYVKVLLDQLFGENNFQNEIIWKRTTAHADTHGFGHVHDIVFRYSNGGKPVFNPQLKDYSQDYVESYFIYEDERVATLGKYRLNDLTGSGLRNGETGKPWRGIDPARIGKGRHWMRTPDELEEMAADGRIYPVSSSATPRRKKHDELALKERWYPIQVKQKTKAGRPDIDSFEAVMMREGCDIGFFVSFDFTEDADAEIGAFFKRTGKTIRALTVRDILDEAKPGMKLA